MTGRARRPTVLLVAIWVTFGCTEQDPEQPRRPNFVVVLADDLRADGLASTGHPYVETPRLDELAARGIVFETADVVTPLCSPSRATLLTGLYAHRNGVTNNQGDLLPGVRTLPMGLQSLGYRTAFIGKHHIGSGTTPAPGYDRWVAYTRQGEYEDAPLNVDGTTRTTRGYSTDVLGDFAVDWIESNRDQPFLMMLWLKNPHFPATPHPRHRSLYENDLIDLPESRADPKQSLPEMLRGGEIAARAGDEEALQQAARTYARMIPSIDEIVGRVVDALEDAGVLEDTLLVFTSDNGRLMGEHGLMGKSAPYEPATRVPLIVHYPRRFPGGLRVRQQVLNLDLAPTILELAGASVPLAEMDGRSFLPLIQDPRQTLRDAWLLHGAYPAGGQPRFLGVVTDEWKYVRYVSGARIEEQLFLRSEDPDERHDLSGDRPEQLEKMRERLRELLQTDGMPRHWFDLTKRTSPTAT